MSIQISKGAIFASINPKGAQLKSLTLGGHPYLWEGNSTSWNDSSPQLFPVIGMTPPGGWLWKGKEMTLGNHGFARNSDFEITDRTESEVTLVLSDNEEIREFYPAQFKLAITFRITGKSLYVSYSVNNRGDDEILFSLGAHPGFRCPLEEGLTFSDYHIKFSEKETIKRRLKDDYLTGEVEPSLYNQDRLDLNHPLFDRGALIYHGLKSESISLESEKGSRSVTLDFKGFPDFGIWTKPGANAPYICLEPWFGVDSSLGDVKDFTKKEGLVSLEAGKTFHCSYSLTLK